MNWKKLLAIGLAAIQLGLSPASAKTAFIPKAYQTQQQVAGFSMYADLASVNTNSFTQIQAREAVFVNQNCSTFKITIGNVFRNAGGDITLPDATWRVGVFDPVAQTWATVNFGGSASTTLTSGQLATSDAFTFPVTKAGTYPNGKLLYLIKYVTYASAPANFPSGHFVATGGNFNEWGNSLSDKTRSGTFTAAIPAGGFNVVPVLAFTCQRTKTPVVAILGDSIGSDFANDTVTDYLSGFTSNALSLAGIPFINVGVSSLAMVSFMGSAQATLRARIYATMVAAGVTYCFNTLGTNDWAVSSGPQTAASLYALQLQLKSELAAFGIQLIPVTLQPRTNAANNGMNGSETQTFTQRPLYNANIIASNGVGYGYYDLAAQLQDSVNNNLWRTDLSKVTAVGINTAGGPGYVSNSILNLPNAVRVRITATAGAVSAVTLRRGGATATSFTTPAGAVSGFNGATSTGNSNVGGPSPGTGALFDLTTAAAGLDTVDGIHPGPTYHAWAQQDLTTQAPIVFH